MKKIIKLLGAFIFGISCFTLIACANISENNNENNISVNDSGAQGEIDDTMFSSGDVKEISESEYDGEINLSTLNSNYTISTPGTYHVTGTSNDYQLIINYANQNEKNVHLVLDNVTMTNSKNACIYVKSAEKVVIHLVGENSITTTYTSKVNDGTSSIDGAIYSKDDLTITGSGSLKVNSKIHGIVCKDDMKFTGGIITINSDSKGIDANDSLRIKESNITIISGSDGVHLENDSNDTFFYMESGTLNITATNDGIDCSTSSNSFSGYISMVGGIINITSGGGSGKSASSSTSTKGIKSDGTITISGGTTVVNSSDDSIHAASTIYLKGGVLDLKTGDDAIHSDTKVVISGGTISANAHEGIEGKSVEISGGTMTIVASDDGINASNSITVSGGYIDISMGNGDVDGVDSNGTYTQTGGFVVARVPGANEMAAPLDTDSTVKITGGTFIALGYFNTAQSSTTVPSISFGSNSFGGGARGFMGGGPGMPGGNNQSSSVTFTSGTYTVCKSDSSDVILTFSLTQSYSALTIVSDMLSTGNNYVLNCNGSTYKTWSQSSTSVTGN
ncbi:MAG: carbohydrate-binding domain-containing protein [Acholeplasmatales bacterium]|nr:carbohydrate-binding domain-containing protein [Acholeplasmatales bacterium]